MKQSRVGNNLIIVFNQPIEEIRVGDFLDSLMLKNINGLYDKIILNKQKAELNAILKSKDILILPIFEDKEIDFECDESELQIVYEDELLLIVYKEANILVHPDNKKGHGTLANKVAYYYACNGINNTIRHLHRLDTQTSGLVMFSKCEALQPLFDKMISEKNIHRHYLAVVDGYLREKSKIVIEAKIGRDRHNAKRFRVSDSGKEARTSIICRRANLLGKYSLVECILDSGRTHQIRVHLNHIKHSIVSDPLYGDMFNKMPRMALMAYKLVFCHPITKENVSLELELDNDIKKAFEI